MAAGKGGAVVSIEIRCSRDHSLRIERAIISGNVSLCSSFAFRLSSFLRGNSRDEASLRAAAAAPCTCSFRAVMETGDFGGL